VQRSRTFSKAASAALLALLALLAFALAAPLAHAEKVPSPWTFTEYGAPMRSISCSSPGDCVAVGQRGMVLRSTLGQDEPLAWSRIPMEYPEELDGVTCNRAFCLAVANTRYSEATYVSKVFRSDDHGATWSAGVALPPDGKLKTRSALGLACQGEECFAVGPAGGVWRSADGGLTWVGLDIPDKPADYEKVACPSAGSCVTIGGEEANMSSAVIEAGTVTALPMPKKAGKAMQGLACDTDTRCTATDGLGHYFSIELPGTKWGEVQTFPIKEGAVSALSCPSKGVCVGLFGGLALRTTNLGEPKVEWRRRPIGTLGLKTLDCVGDACVGSGEGAAWWEGPDDGYQWGRVNEAAKFDAAECPGGAGWHDTCVAGGEHEIGLSTSGGELWQEPLAGVTGLNIKAVNCTGSADCLLLGKTEALFTDNIRTAGPESFEPRTPTTVDPAGTDAQTCVTRDTCVGVGEGVTYTTFDGARSGWGQASFPERAGAVGCVPGRTDPVVCIAATREFVLLGTMTKSGDKAKWAWRTTDANPKGTPEGVACSPGGQCTVVGTEGMVLSSEAGGLMKWKELQLPEHLPAKEVLPAFKSVACPANGTCLVGGKHGAKVVVATTENDWADYSMQELQGVEGAEPTINAFGCETTRHCVGVGGTVLVATREAPGDDADSGAGRDRHGRRSTHTAGAQH
jgi:photosystem II stability/assembly factor-like uncharacterized protein